jgi:hypothetical protein
MSLSVKIMGSMAFSRSYVLYNYVPMPITVVALAMYIYIYIYIHRIIFEWMIAIIAQ